MGGSSFFKGGLMSQYEIFKFAFFPTYQDNIKFLADSLADKEEWDYSDSKEKTYPILKSYLEHTFRKIQQEKKLAFTPNNKYACFNTGLVTENLEDIFAYFEANKNLSVTSSTPFCFKAFLRKSDNQLLKNFPDNLPDAANYFEKPELLIFNPKFDLIPDIDHIINDNKDRFPRHLQLAYGAEVRRHLKGSIDEIKMKVRTNYKLAVPQYYDGKIQLLLPLCLTAGTNNPELALVIYQLGDKAYTARTCLTLKMAYNNARLIVKPQSDWLKP